MIKLLPVLSIILIVCSSLAFKTKKGGFYCASKIQNQNCAVIREKTEINNGNPHCTYYKYAEWDGNPANCLPDRCPTMTTLYNEE